jgi:ketosteroid isomerase-like protein
MECRAATTVSVVGIMVCAVCAFAGGGGSEAEAVGAVLDAFHRAASEADGDRYFGFFAEDAVFLGTDASERWSVEEFQAFAEPYFAAGRGWTYTPQERHVVVSADGATAWFDELLSNDAYGTCRGSGVLLLTGSGWRIAQYNLSIPIPNELAAEVVAIIGAGGSQ